MSEFIKVSCESLGRNRIHRPPCQMHGREIESFASSAGCNEVCAEMLLGRAASGYSVVLNSPENRAPPINTAPAGEWQSIDHSGPVGWCDEAVEGDAVGGCSFKTRLGVSSSRGQFTPVIAARTTIKASQMFRDNSCRWATCSSSVGPVKYTHSKKNQTGGTSAQKAISISACFFFFSFGCRRIRNAHQRDKPVSATDTQATAVRNSP